MHPATRRIAAARCVILAACLAFLVTLALPGAARAQIPSGPPPSCKQLWEEAGALADRAAQAQAKLASGAPPDAAATHWAQAWMHAWIAVWSAQGSTLKPGPRGDCCHINWF